MPLLRQAMHFWSTAGFRAPDIQPSKHWIVWRCRPSNHSPNFSGLPISSAPIQPQPKFLGTADILRTYAHGIVLVFIDRVIRHGFLATVFGGGLIKVFIRQIFHTTRSILFLRLWSQLWSTWFPENWRYVRARTWDRITLSLNQLQRDVMAETLRLYAMNVVNVLLGDVRRRGLFAKVCGSITNAFLRTMVDIVTVAIKVFFEILLHWTLVRLGRSLRDALIPSPAFGRLPILKPVAHPRSDDLFGSIPIARKLDIRLVELQPGKFADDIRCRLVLWNLGMFTSDYYALSYACGTDEPSHEVIINRHHVLKVRKNLATALRYLRKKKGSFWLWVDAICIDQSNTREKNIQVAFIQSYLLHGEGSSGVGRRT
jgi:hypothetical protein